MCPFSLRIYIEKKNKKKPRLSLVCWQRDRHTQAGRVVRYTLFQRVAADRVTLYGASHRLSVSGFTDIVQIPGGGEEELRSGIL